MGKRYYSKHQSSSNRRSPRASPTCPSNQGSRSRSPQNVVAVPQHVVPVVVPPHLTYFQTNPNWTIRVFKTRRAIRIHTDQFAQFLTYRGIHMQNRENLMRALEAVNNRHWALVGDAAQMLLVRDHHTAALNNYNNINTSSAQNSRRPVCQYNHQYRYSDPPRHLSRGYYQHQIAGTVLTNAYQACMAVKYGFDQFIYCHGYQHRRFQFVDDQGILRASVECKVLADVMEAVMGVIKADGPGWEERLMMFMKVFELDWDAARSYLEVNGEKTGRGNGN